MHLPIRLKNRPVMTSPKQQIQEVKDVSDARRDSDTNCELKSLGGQYTNPEDVKSMTPAAATLPEIVKARETNSKLFRSSEDDELDGDEVNDDIPASQITLSQGMSQTDETIRRLEREGELNEVIGSQSLLSQELICSSQRTEIDADEKDLSNFQLSQQTETSIAMAQRLGLLTQEEEIKDRDNPASNKESPASKARNQKDGTSVAISPTPKSSAPGVGISDTPVRESECFGSLLDAVERITKEEELNAKMLAWQYAHEGTKKNEIQLSNNPQEAASSGTNVKKKSGTKRKLPTSKKVSTPPTSPKKSRKSAATRKKEQEQRKSQEVAQIAARLAEQTITDPELAKKLLLSMALVRENPRTVPSVLPPRGAVVPEGFFWAHYPPLEAVLKKHMAEYYELSTTKCQSAQQQTFNNDLVILVREVASERGWRFHKNFSDKGLRDRIRCYYKTHIQNAKKRLRTMVRNPTKRANARHLCAHLELIEQHGCTDLVKTDNGNDDDDNENTSQHRSSKLKTERVKSSNSSTALVAEAASPNQTSRSRSTRSTRTAVKVEL